MKALLIVAMLILGACARDVSHDETGIQNNPNALSQESVSGDWYFLQYQNGNLKADGYQFNFNGNRFTSYRYYNSTSTGGSPIYALEESAGTFEVKNGFIEFTVEMPFCRRGSQYSLGVAFMNSSSSMVLTFPSNNSSNVFEKGSVTTELQRYDPIKLDNCPISKISERNKSERKPASIKHKERHK